MIQRRAELLTETVNMIHSEIRPELHSNHVTSINVSFMACDAAYLLNSRFHGCMTALVLKHCSYALLCMTISL